MFRSLHVLGPVAALALVSSGVPAAMRPASPAGTAKLTAIVVRGVDRSGVTRQLRGFFHPVAVRFFRDGYEALYYPDSRGVLHVRAGTYLIGMDIPTFGPQGNQISDTLAVRSVRAPATGGTRTVIVDARQGQLVGVSLTLPGARAEFVTATLCASGSAYKGLLGFALASAPARTGDSVYAIPSHASNLRFLMGSAWQGPDGSQYGLGANAPGIPGHPDFSFRPSDLARLTFRAASGANVGSSGSVSTWFGPCPADGPSFPLVPLPGRVTEHVSAGRWAAQLTINGPADDGTTMVQDVTAGHAYTRTFGGAVFGPWSMALPRYDSALRRGYLTVGLSDLIQDPAASGGALFPTNGIARLVAGHRLIKAYRFKDGSLFTATLRWPGWYTISLSARRNPPPAGVTPATLSTRVGLTWRFAASASDLAGSVNRAPVSVTTFDPQGLNLRNQAALLSVTPIRLVIGRGRPDRAYRIKTMRLEVSRDGGLSWHSVPVTARARSWLADVPSPFSGFVSLRSIVTDIRGDRTVETIYRAYEVM